LKKKGPKRLEKKKSHPQKRGNVPKWKAVEKPPRENPHPIISRLRVGIRRNHEKEKVKGGETP